MKAAIAGLGVAAVVGLAACGGGMTTYNGLRPDAAKQLQGDVLTLTQQAAAKNWSAARTALSTLRADLDASVAAGAVSAQRAAAIRATATQIAAELPAVTPAPTPTPTPTQSSTAVQVKAPAKPAPAPAPPKHHHDHGDG